MEIITILVVLLGSLFLGVFLMVLPIYICWRICVWLFE